MHAETSLEEPSSEDRSERHVWYFTAMGLISGTAIVTSALLPEEVAGVALTTAALLVGLIDIIARRVGSAPTASPLRAETIIYCVAVAVVLIGSLVVAWTVRNSDALWLAWILAGVMFIVALSGTWIVGGRIAHKTASL